MLFIVRGKTSNTNSVLRIDADNAKQAEAIGWSRGLFVTDVAAAETQPARSTIARFARLAYRLWRRVPPNPYVCFGQPLSSAQSAALIVLGMTTWMVLLNSFGFVRM